MTPNKTGAGIQAQNRHSWKEKRKEGYKIIQECSVCGCLKWRGTTKLRMAIVGSKDYYKYESVWYYANGKATTIKAPKCISHSPTQN